MHYWSFMFPVLALIAGIFGFSSLAGGTAVIAQVLCGVFLVLWMVAAFGGSVGGNVR